MGAVFLITGVVVFIAAAAGIFEISLGVKKKNNRLLWIGVALLIPLILMVVINLIAVMFFAGFR